MNLDKLSARQKLQLGAVSAIFTVIKAKIFENAEIKIDTIVKALELNDILTRIDMLSNILDMLKEIVEEDDEASTMGVQEVGAFLIEAYDHFNQEGRKTTRQLQNMMEAIIAEETKARGAAS